MTLTAEALVARKSRVGASEVAAILGMPTFAGHNAYSVWLDKTSQLEEDATPPDHIAAGTMLEPSILNWAESRYGDLERDVVVHDPSGAPIASTLDARIIASGRPVEAKTSGITGPIHGQWGEPGTDEVPDGYVIQCMTQLLCTGSDVCHLVALLGGRGFVEYTIIAHEALMQTIRDVAVDFFERYVENRHDPRGEWGDRLREVHGLAIVGDPCEPMLGDMQQLRRVEGKSITASDEQAELFYQWDEARRTRLDAKKTEDQLLAQCLAVAGDAEAVRLPDGSTFTYRQQRGADSIDRAAMKEAGVYEQFARPNTYRVARFKKARN